MRKILLILFISVLTTCITFAQVEAQTRVTGKLLDAQTKEPLIGASVLVKGTTVATSAALDGSFKINVPEGSDVLVVTYIGYVTKQVTIGGKKVLGNIFLDPTAAAIKEVTITSNTSLAIDRHTPIAVSSVNAQFIEEKGAGAEFPELLKETPGVTVTRSGGGYGDSRIAIRGFNSNNVALLINGLPANDPEAGRIYWNDWAGLSDVTTSMQVQRGLGASTVAVPSLGGTINITTKSTEANQGGVVSQSIGSYGALKTMVSYSTGLSDKGWASSFLLSKSTGDGNREGLYYTGYNYFFNISKIINSRHTISANILGASQNHGQGYSYANINFYRAAPQGPTRYNSDYGYLDGQLKSAEVNFYNKPLASITHSWTIDSKSSLSTVGYGTWGTGAAVFLTGSQSVLTGPTANVPRTGNAYSPIDFNAIVKSNMSNFAAESKTILQNAANDHDQYGLFSTYKKKVGENIDILAGLDLRDYRGYHYYQVNDLLGGSFFADNTDLNNPNRRVTTGDRINRNYFVDLVSEGLYLQGEYTKDKLSVVVAIAGNNTSNKRTDYYNYLSSDRNRVSPWVNFLGYEAKGGANYNIDNHSNVFANIGYLQRAPLIATVFLNNKNDVNKDAKPEKLTSFELGYGYVSSLFSVNINAYYSPYKDRAKVFSAVNADNTITTLNVTGINEIHQGVELETKFRPVKDVTLHGSLSIGDYHYTSNTGAAQAISDAPGAKPVNSPSLYLKGIKIGDFGSSAASNAQTTASLGADVQVVPQFKVGGSMVFAGDYFASYDPSKLTAQNGFDLNKYRPLGLPNYSTVDVNFVYRFKFAGLDASFVGNVYNLLNTLYISEGYEGTPAPLATDVTRLGSVGVNYGTGRIYMTTLKIKF